MRGRLTLHGECLQRVAAPEEGRDDARDRVRRLRAIAVRVVPVAVVQEDDTPGARPAESAPGDLGGAGTIAVPHAEGPADAALREAMGRRRHEGGTEAVRGAKVPRCDAAGVDDRARPGGEVIGGTAGSGKVQLAMGKAVVRHLVSLVGDAPHERRPARDVSSEQEEGRVNAMLAEDVEDTRCRRGVGPVVERQRDPPRVTRQARQDGAEEGAVAVQRRVGPGGGDGEADGRGEHRRGGEFDHATRCASTLHPARA